MDPAVATTPQKKDSSDFINQLTLSPASLNEMESKMRDEIRKLQERRVGVLMDEVMQLQNERETLLPKLNNLENENKRLKEENTTLKRTEKPSVQIEVLEKALQQEKDEKDKLKQRLKVVKRRTSGLPNDINLDKEKSSSMNDLADKQCNNGATFIKDMKLKRPNTKTFGMLNTPSPRTKRYVLAATSTKDASTQTSTSSDDDVATDTADEYKKAPMISEDLKAALSEAKDTILEVLQEKEVSIHYVICRAASFLASVSVYQVNADMFDGIGISQVCYAVQLPIPICLCITGNVVKVNNNKIKCYTVNMDKACFIQ